MNRRTFLTRLGVGIVATAALAHIPASVIKSSEWLAGSGRYWATKKLQALNFEYYNKTGRWPKEFIASRDFFDLFESELQAANRFVDKDDVKLGYTSLQFKGAKLRWDSHLQGYTVLVRGYEL